MSQPPEWAAKYVGIDFKLRGRTIEALDCWGLFQIVYKDQFNIDLPAYDSTDYENMEDGERWQKLGKLITSESSDGQIWIPVVKGQEQEGDGLVIRMLGQYTHVAVAINNEWMLHTEKGIGVVLEQYKTGKWSKRVVGIYRHVGLCTPHHRATS